MRNNTELKCLSWPSIIFLALAAYTGTTYPDSQTIVGWIEPAKLHKYDMRFRAKLDTGADISSLNATILNTVTINGREYVRFEIKDRNGKYKQLELPIQRRSIIKRHLTKNQKRPVILLEICVGQILKKVEVNLINRSKFKYQFLLGRNFLSPDHLVDSSKKNTSSPNCTK